VTPLSLLPSLSSPSLLLFSQWLLGEKKHRNLLSPPAEVGEVGLQEVVKEVVKEVKPFVGSWVFEVWFGMVSSLPLLSAVFVEIEQ